MALFVLFGGGGMFLLNRNPSIAPFSPTPASPPPTPAPIDWTAERYKDLLAQARHSRGEEKSPRLTVIEFGDLECPSCRRAYNEYLVKIEKKIPIHFVFFHFPLPMHHEAIPAAIATEAAGKQGKFWTMFDMLYLGENTPITDDLIKTSAQNMGLDMPRFGNDMVDAGIKDTVEKDAKLAVSLHLSQTPTFIIRDEKTGKIEQAAGASGIDDIVSRVTHTPKLIPPTPAP